MLKASRPNNILLTKSCQNSNKFSFSNFYLRHELEHPNVVCKQKQLKILILQIRSTQRHAVQIGSGKICLDFFSLFTPFLSSFFSRQPSSQHLRLTSSLLRVLRVQQPYQYWVFFVKSMPLTVCWEKGREGMHHGFRMHFSRHKIRHLSCLGESVKTRPNRLSWRIVDFMAFNLGFQEKCILKMW